MILWFCEMAKQGMEELEGDGEGRVAFQDAEHPPFLPVLPCIQPSMKRTGDNLSGHTWTTETVAAPYLEVSKDRLDRAWNILG